MNSLARSSRLVTIVLAPAVIRSNPTTMEAITASATASCPGARQELACTGDDGAVACCDPLPHAHICLPRSARTPDYSSSGGCGDVCASVCVRASTERRGRDMMGVRTLLPSRCGREVSPASARDGLVLPRDSCPIHKKRGAGGSEGRGFTPPHSSFFSYSSFAAAASSLQ